MRFRSVTAGMVVLAVTTVLAQQSSPVAATVGGPVIQRNSLAGKRGVSSLAGSKTAGVQTPPTLRERVQDMGVTLAKMHAVLTQMRAKAASSSKDPLAKANLDMWELMVGHLDKQFQELRVAMLAREDMDTRRAAMYKQAEAKADAAAQAARGLSGQTVTAARAGQRAGQSADGQPAAGQPSTPSPTTASPSPN